jgi:hypothetical protein
MVGRTRVTDLERVHSEPETASHTAGSVIITSSVLSQ